MEGKRLMFFLIFGFIEITASFVLIGFFLLFAWHFYPLFTNFSEAITISRLHLYRYVNRTLMLTVELLRIKCGRKRSYKFIWIFDWKSIVTRFITSVWLCARRTAWFIDLFNCTNLILFTININEFSNDWKRSYLEIRPSTYSADTIVKNINIFFIFFNFSLSACLRLRFVIEQQH